MADVEDGGEAALVKIGPIQPAVPHRHLVDAEPRRAGNAPDERGAGRTADIKDADLWETWMDLVEIRAIDEQRMHAREAAVGWVNACELDRLVGIGHIDDIDAARVRSVRGEEGDAVLHLDIDDLVV